LEPDEFLEKASAQADGSPVELTIRELLAIWGAKRRGVWIVDRIKRDLRNFGLATLPPFEEEWIDNRIQIVPRSRAAVANALHDPDARPPTIDDPPPLPEVGLRVGVLKSASSKVEFVAPDSDVSLATSIMLRYDYSQLAVMSGERTIRGAVSWESIAKAGVRRAGQSLSDAVIAATIVNLDDDLLAQIPRIYDVGFVFVRDREQKICGIVTTADLSLEFGKLATPFFLIGEIERRLRRLVSDHFSADELAALGDLDGRTEITTPHDTTLGDLQRLFGDRNNWPRLGWAIDRGQFIAALNEVREIRNEVVHFSPDPLTDDQQAALHNFLNWLRILDPR
jgi:restriction system protein